MSDQESKEADDDQRQHPDCVILLVVEQHNPSQACAADYQHLKQREQRAHLIATVRSTRADVKFPSKFLNDGCIHSFYLVRKCVIHTDSQAHLHVYHINKTSSFKRSGLHEKRVMFSKDYAYSLKLPIYIAPVAIFKISVYIFQEMTPLALRKKITDIPGYCYVLLSTFTYMKQHYTYESLKAIH